MMDDNKKTNGNINAFVDQKLCDRTATDLTGIVPMSPEEIQCNIIP